MFVVEATVAVDALEHCKSQFIVICDLIIACTGDRVRCLTNFLVEWFVYAK